MKPNRQQWLLILLAVIGAVRVGDWILNTLIQGPLQERRARTTQLQKDIASREKLLAETREAGRKLEVWQKQSLPADPEIARSAYRSWLLSLVKNAKLRNATVDSGAPSSRRARDNSVLYRSLPFSVRARGTLSQFNEFLFQVTRAGHLHQISTLTLNPISNTGQFDLAMAIDTLLLPGRRGDQLYTGPSSLPASSEFSHYDVIVKDNVFGIGLNPADPMKHTFVSAITFSNGSPLVWITEELSSKVTRTGLQAEFETVALSGRIVGVRDQEVVVETSGERLLLPIGKPFAEATSLPAPSVDEGPASASSSRP